MSATVAVAPTLLPFRRALARLLALPVGQSGSGPTCWILYPTLAAARSAARVVERAVASGTLPEVGHGAPFVAATTILTRRAASAAEHGSASGRRRGHRVPHGDDNVDQRDDN